jgi:hypothetical protein
MTIEVVSKEEYNKLLERVIHLERLVSKLKSQEFKETLTLKEACDYLKVSANTLMKYRCKKLITANKINGKVYFSKTDLDNLSRKK